MKTALRTISFAFCISTALVAGSNASAADDVEHPKKLAWVFDGAFGKFDRQSIQRGFQVYTEVCAACHGMHLIHYRNLQDVGFSENEVKAIAANVQVQDGPNDEGDMFDRPGRPSDKFKEPYANEKAGRAANGGAYPPDLSLMIKARHDGANYVYSLLTGYSQAPSDFALPEGKYYNAYFPGKAIAMPPPLTAEGQVTYQDASVKGTVDQYAQDVVNFMQWAAEPEMEVRKQTGFKVLLFMAVFTGLFYAAKVRIWSRLKDEN